jgi:hypothetical protein
MSRALDDLSSDLKPLAIEVLARLTERGIHVLIVDTLRTMAEHQANLANGSSAARLSKHLPRHMRIARAGTAEDHKSDAIDLCLFEQYNLHGPDKLKWTADPAWDVIRDLGEGLGLRSGSRWASPYDPGHLEWLFPWERHKDIPRSSAAFFAHGIAT